MVNFEEGKSKCVVKQTDKKERKKDHCSKLETNLFEENIFRTCVCVLLLLLMITLYLCWKSYIAQPEIIMLASTFFFLYMLLLLVVSCS